MVKSFFEPSRVSHKIYQQGYLLAKKAIEVLLVNLPWHFSDGHKPRFDSTEAATEGVL